MTVSRRNPAPVRSLQDLGTLFKPVPTNPLSTKEIEMIADTNETMNATPAQMPSFDELQSASTNFRHGLADVDKARAEITAQSQQMAELVQQTKTMIDEKVVKNDEILKKLSNDLQSLQEGKPVYQPKKPIYIRALTVAQEAGGLGAFIFGIACASFYAYDHLVNKPETLPAE